MGVGIFGDQLIPLGPPVDGESNEISEPVQVEAPVEVVEKTPKAVEVAEETSVEETSEVVEDAHEEHLTAKEVIEEIEAATSVEEVDALAADDDRKTVIAAAAKRKEELAD